MDTCFKKLIPTHKLLEVKATQLDNFLLQNTFIFGKQDNSYKNTVLEE